MKTYHSKTQFLAKCAAVAVPLVSAVTLFIYLSIKGKPELGEETAREIALLYLSFCTLIFCIITPVAAKIIVRTPACKE